MEDFSMFKHSILRHLLSSCAFAAPAEGAGGSRPAKSSVPAAGKSPFAHLARNAPKAAEDDKDENKDKDAAEDDGEEDDEDDDGKKTKKSKKAKKAKADDDGDSEDSDDDASASEDDDGEDDKPKSKKSKKAEDGDDDSDRDDDDDAKARAARARERGRIKAIVTSSAGVLNPVGAMELACGTSMSRRQAIGMLNAMGVPQATAPRSTDALRNRMSGVDTPDIGSGGVDAPPVGSAQATAAAIVAAGKKRRGEA
jgi:hypothetical protein